MEQKKMQAEFHENKELKHPDFHENEELMHRVFHENNGLTGTGRVNPPRKMWSESLLRRLNPQ